MKLSIRYGWLFRHSALDGNPPKSVCLGGNANATLSQLSFTCSDSKLAVCLGGNVPQPPKQSACEIPDESQYVREQICISKIPSSPTPSPTPTRTPSRTPSPTSLPPPPMSSLCLDFTVSAFGVQGDQISSFFWRGYKFRVERETQVMALTSASLNAQHAIFRLGGTNNDILEEIVTSLPASWNTAGDPMVLSEPVTLSSDQWYFLGAGGHVTGGILYRSKDVDVEAMKEAAGIAEWEPSTGTRNYEIWSLSGNNHVEDLIGWDLADQTTTSEWNDVVPDLGFQGTSEACEPEDTCSSNPCDKFYDDGSCEAECDNSCSTMDPCDPDISDCVESVDACAVVDSSGIDITELQPGAEVPKCLGPCLGECVVQPNHHPLCCSLPGSCMFYSNGACQTECAAECEEDCSVHEVCSDATSECAGFTPDDDDDDDDDYDGIVTCVDFPCDDYEAQQICQSDCRDRCIQNGCQYHSQCENVESSCTAPDDCSVDPCTKFAGDGSCSNECTNACENEALCDESISDCVPNGEACDVKQLTNGVKCGDKCFFACNSGITPFHAECSSGDDFEDDCVDDNDPACSF